MVAKPAVAVVGHRRDCGGTGGEGAGAGGGRDEGQPGRVDQGGDAGEAGAVRAEGATMRADQRRRRGVLGGRYADYQVVRLSPKHGSMQTFDRVTLVADSHSAKLRGH